MRAEIKANLDNPGLLEKLYRDNRVAFKREFNRIYPEINERAIAQCWNARINFETEEISWGSSKELSFILLTCFLAGLIAKIPDFTGLAHDYFYPRNLAFIVFPALTAYFAWKHKVQTKSILPPSVAFLVSLVYINLLPDTPKSDTLNLACIHLALFSWSVLGFTYLGNQPNSNAGRLDFLRYNADLVVMTALIAIAGGLLTGVTFGLFELIGIRIQDFYSHYILMWGIPSAPIFGTYLVQTNPQLVNKVSPILAKVFTPLVLVMLLVYLGALLYTGKDPYNDREFLLIFNLLLVGVMAIILFSIAGTSKNAQSKIGTILLLGLSLVTVIVNGIALSAVVFRIAEWGITPNRLVVLGGNILILTNLIWVAYQLFRAVRDQNEMEKVENSIASFLPVYSIWALFVTFLVPVLFNFR